MNKALIIAIGISVLVLVSACTHRDPYKPGCYDKTVTTWDKAQKKWVKTTKPVCSLGNIY